MGCFVQAGQAQAECVNVRFAGLTDPDKGFTELSDLTAAAE